MFSVKMDYRKRLKKYGVLQKKMKRLQINFN